MKRLWVALVLAALMQVGLAPRSEAQTARIIAHVAEYARFSRLYWAVNPYEWELVRRGTIASVGERFVVQRDELIDPLLLDGVGRTNLERMLSGLPPVDRDRLASLELHHLGQQSDGYLLEITRQEHRTDGNYCLAHPGECGAAAVESLVDHGVTWNKWRADYWRRRAADFDE